MIKSLDARGLPPPPYIQFIPTLPTITFCIIYLTFIYLKSIYLTFDFFHIVHNHSHIALVELCHNCYGHIALPDSVTGLLVLVLVEVRRGLLMVVGRFFFGVDYRL